MAAAENLATLSDLIFGKPDSNGSNSNETTYLLRPNVYTTPVYLNFPSEVPEDHVTFLFGIILLISMAICCTVFILKLTKPKFVKYFYSVYIKINFKVYFGTLDNNHQ